MGYEQSHHQIFPMMKHCVMLLLLCCAVIVKADEALTLEIESDELMKTGDLEQAETKDASATEIIKQIRKVNADGTYTIGFEADDGTFKIETRDLQGNVKQGTYGYVDANGEVKRVVYSTENSTLHKEHKSSEDEDDSKDENEKETINLASSLRYNRTFVSTTRRPSSLSYLTSTAGPTFKPSVIQNIPKRRILLPSERSASRSQSDSSKQSFEGTTTVVYATSVPTPKPYSSRSTTSPSYPSKATDRSDRVEIDQVERKVFISTAKEVTTMKPVLSKERNDEKVDYSRRGNNLRRQLKQDDEGIEAQQQVLYGSGDESSAVYGGGFGSVRPLFSTTSQPRVPYQVLAARQRATQLQSILANSQPSTTTEKAYAKLPKRQNIAKVKVEEVTESLDENFLTQPPQIEQIPGAGSENTDDRRAFQRPLPPQLEGLYRPRNYLRQLQQQQQQQQLQQQPQDLPPQDPRLSYRIPPNAPGPDPTDLRQPIPQAAQRFAQQYQPQGQQQQNQPIGFPNQPAESFASPFGPQRPGYDLDRPLTVRDFERLLQVLVFRQQQPQQPYRVNPYYPPSNPASYPPFIPGYNQPYSQIPRPPFFNPVTSGLYDQGYQNPYYSPSSPVSQQYPGTSTQPNDGMFQQAQQNPQQQVVDPNYDQRFIPRRRQYDPRLYGQQSQGPVPQNSEQELNFNSLQSSLDNNYLPPSVREQLLYRMLMLAIRGDQQYSPSSTTAAATAAASSSEVHTVLEPEQQEANTISVKSSTVASKKPVRSVQILGEEETD